MYYIKTTETSKVGRLITETVTEFNRLGVKTNRTENGLRFEFLQGSEEDKQNFIEKLSELLHQRKLGTFE